MNFASICTYSLEGDIIKSNEKKKKILMELEDSLDFYDRTGEFLNNKTIALGTCRFSSFIESRYEESSRSKRHFREVRKDLAFWITSLLNSILDENVKT